MKKYYVIVDDNNKLLRFKWLDRYEEYYIMYFDEKKPLEGIDEVLFSTLEEANKWITDLQNKYFDKDTDIDVFDLRVNTLHLEIKYYLNELK